MEERKNTKLVCEYCGGELVPTGIMCSGNAHYTIYECKQCYKETSRCEGLASPVIKTA